MSFTLKLSNTYTMMLFYFIFVSIWTHSQVYRNEKKKKKKQKNNNSDATLKFFFSSIKKNLSMKKKEEKNSCTPKMCAVQETIGKSKRERCRCLFSFFFCFMPSIFFSSSYVCCFSPPPVRKNVLSDFIFIFRLECHISLQFSSQISWVISVLLYIFVCICSIKLILGNIFGCLAK